MNNIKMEDYGTDFKKIVFNHNGYEQIVHARINNEGKFLIELVEANVEVHTVYNDAEGNKIIKYAVD
jgi:hypothetical protein